MPEFPNIVTLWEAYQVDPSTQKHVLHNSQILRCIRGGLVMAQKYSLDFDPRKEYWRRIERRLLVAYFASYWGYRMTPVQAVRDFAKKTFRHFEPLGMNHQFQVEDSTDYLPQAMDPVLVSLLAHTATLDVEAEWRQLKAVWRSSRFPVTAKEHLHKFFQQAMEQLKTDSQLESKLKIGFQDRLPWFAYMGAQTDAELEKRQKFFFGLANLLTTSNAYVHGGSMVLGPMIQNTPSSHFLKPLSAWSSDGGKHGDPDLSALGANDDQERNCNFYKPVLEVYGFLRLHNLPYYNQIVEDKFGWLNAANDPNPLTVMQRIAERTSQQLAAQPDLVPALAGAFRSLLQKPLSTRVWMEWTTDDKANRNKETAESLIDFSLREELTDHAFPDGSLEDSKAAVCMAHLLLDGFAYGHAQKLLTALPAADGTACAVPTKKTLPDGLWEYGQRALAILRAGRHVLLAGAPGTGKTTLATFVAQAWNKGNEVPLETIASDDEPFVTVANSAWSPFHTVGGILPDEKNQPHPNPGVFIDELTAGEDGQWKLRNHAVIVDELNRADMDRCIGELYPLLSKSVDHVKPAGLPGVHRVALSERFRIIATANMDLSDVVFPMSEGLARRFQMIELPGASKDDVLSYLLSEGKVDENNSRYLAAKNAVLNFFASIKGSKLLMSESGDDNDRLSIGAGYFGLLKDWVAGDFTLSAENSDVDVSLALADLARRILAQSLRTASLSQEIGTAIKVFEAEK